jgi:hypothetical protein
MPEIGREVGQMTLDVDATAIPSQQRVDGKSMAITPRAA